MRNISHRHRGVSLFTAALYIAAVCFGVYCLALRRDSLQFHDRDYAYFIEQAARLADPGLANRYALNIEGFNFIGLQGIEGVENLYQAIHTEYFRYTYTLIYFLFRDTLPIYIFYALIFFFPVLYLALLPRPRPGGRVAVVLFGLLWVLAPVMVSALTFDMRSRNLFGAAWSLVALAVFYDRPFIEKLLFFGLLLSIREEGFVLGLPLIALNFLRMIQTGAPPRRRWAQALALLALDALAAALFLAFMRWGGYTRIDAYYDPLNLARHWLAFYPFPLLGAGAALLAITTVLWLKKRALFVGWLMLLAFGAALLAAYTPFARDYGQTVAALTAERPLGSLEAYALFMTSPHGGLFFYLLILAWLLAADFLPRGRRLLLAGGGLLCAVFAATTLATAPGQLAAWQQELAPARLVWDFKATLDRYQDQLLVDYDTYQAFFDCENVVVYNRLHLKLVQPEQRFYPHNKDVLARWIKERLQYAVIARGSLENVHELAGMAGVAPAELASNNRYVILKLR